MRVLEITPRINRYLALLWFVYYGALIWFVVILPLGQIRLVALCAIGAMAALSLYSRVLLRWPHPPTLLQCTVSEQGEVSLSSNANSIEHWRFAWTSRRIVVLVVYAVHPLWRWYPLWILWLSPHNTSHQLHRQLRVLARFGHRFSKSNTSSTTLSKLPRA